MFDTKQIQKALRARGFMGKDGKPLTVDGEGGPNTNHAIVAFKRSVGLRARAFVGPVTYAMLMADGTAIKKAIPAGDDPAWFNEMLLMIGKHERRDNAELSAWLRSDGATVGDPSKIPWCGDGVQTAILRALPNEPMPSNPYLAANWAKWAKHVTPQRGAILSFWRGSPTNWQGHVGFYAGESASNFYVLGANQADSITIAPISKKRLRKNGSRWPVGGGVPSGRTVQMTGGVVSTNEA